MSKPCVQCQTANADQAIYCHSCGTVLAGTADGRTVVAPPAPFLRQGKPPGAVCMPAPHTLSPTGWTPVPLVGAQQREHTILVTDTSGSMGEVYDGSHSKLEASQRAEVSLVVNKAQIDPMDEIGLARFDEMAQLVFPISPISTRRKEIIQAIQSLQAGGGTDINEGLKVARDAFDWSRSDVVRRIVLLTDGMGGHPLRTAQELKSRGVIIDVIGVGADPSSGVDEKLLRKLASVVQGELRYRFLKDQQTLVDHVTQIANKTIAFSTR